MVVAPMRIDSGDEQYRNTLMTATCMLNRHRARLKTNAPQRQQSIGLTMPGVLRSWPTARSRGWPGGYWEYHLSRRTTFDNWKKSGEGGGGAVTMPCAKILAWKR